MPIIRYALVNGQTPAGITSRGEFHNSVSDIFIGIGSGVGTELSVDELKTWLKSNKSEMKILHREWDNEIEALASSPIPVLERLATDAEIETMVDDWCTRKGIS